MKRIIASVGLVALGAANVHAQSTSVTGPAAKWWSVEATVRGFYDDNLNTVPSRETKVHVWGYELSPKVGLSIGNDQTTFTADYRYSFLYYDHRPAGQTHKYDQDHLFDAALVHAFSERYTVRVRDNFVVGQEPDALRYGAATPNAAISTPFRVSGNNIVNSGGIAFDAELTPLLGVEVGYDNAWYDYADKFQGGALGTKNVALDGTIIPSNSGLLDRIEQTPHVSLLWHVMPETTASLSYQFGQINYNGNELIAGNFLDKPDALRSSDRDVRSQTLYLGLDHKFRPDFYGSVQAGASYYDYYNIGSTSFGPYARLSLTYVYAQESSLTAGFQEGRSATDVIGSGTNKTDLVTDSETSVVFATVRQRIVPHLFANLNGTAQRSSFNGGGSNFDGKTEYFYEFGANLQYQFNPHFSTEVGYDFDRLDSELGRSYSRNKVYVGATAVF